jgi:hypothetical protein
MSPVDISKLQIQYTLFLLQNQILGILQVLVSRPNRLNQTTYEVPMLFFLALFACQSDSETELTTTLTSTTTSTTTTTTDDRFDSFVSALESDLANSEALGVSDQIMQTSYFYMPTS